MPTRLDFDAFRTSVSESFVPLQVSSDLVDTFRGRVSTGEAAGIHVSDIRATSHTVERTPELIARGDTSFFKLSLMISGTGLLIQDGREAVLHPGDLAVYDTNRPYTLTFEDEPTPFHSMVVMFPHRLLELPAEVISQLTATRMEGSSGLGALITPYLRQLAENLEMLQGATGVRLAQSALDLVTTMFARELDLDRPDVDPHQQLLGRIRAYIDENLSASDLGPARIAAAHFISTRHLHGLFQLQGATVSTWIRTRRLERCHRDLLNPLNVTQPVATIARRWGFSDAAHFSRAFKAEYGVAPSEVRSR